MTIAGRGWRRGRLARRLCQRNQVQGGGGDVERVRQLCCGTEVAQGGGKDGHGNYCGGEDAATGRRRERRRGGRGGGAVMVASFLCYVPTVV